MSDASRVEAIFGEAADLPQADRAEFLERACGADIELRREVEELLGFDRPVPAAHDASTVLEADAPRAALPVATPPRLVGRFEVERILGEGGMGVVYLAEDATLARRVALKLVRAGSAASGRARLLREAQAMARITHPNVVSVFEAGAEDANVWIAMEYVDGLTLAEWLRAPRSSNEILAMLVQAGRGLAAAHRAGLLHRDFKPQNVLVGTDGRARVLDFGLARQAGEADRDVLPARGPTALDLALTRDGTMMGTPGYMSPEHFEGPICPASDQWSFAAALYRAVYRQRPFADDDFETVRRAVLAGELRPPPASDVAPEVEATILRGLSRHPEDRFASLDEMLDVLEEVMGRDPEQDKSRFVRQRRVASAILLVLVTLNVLIAGLRTDFRYDIGVRGVLIQSAMGVVFLAAVAWAFRQTAFRTLHNKKILAALLLPMIVMSLHRSYALGTGAAVEHVLRVDAVMTIGFLAYGALFLERWLAYGALVMALYLPASYLSSRFVVPGFGASLWVVSAISAWCWPMPGQRASGVFGSSRSRSSSSRNDSL
jgi:serine/threonine-protein kinase